MQGRTHVVPALLLVLLAGRAHAKSDPRFAPEATKAIERMSQFLAGAKQFSVTVDIAYDIVQEWGQKIEFGESRKVTLRRPDRLRAEITDRDGSTTGLVFDGKQITAYDVKARVYATEPQPGTLDKAIDHFVDDLGMDFPLAGFLQTGVVKSLDKWAREVRYVEASTVVGTPCDHVAVRGDWEDVQFWIARGDRPLLQRIVITYKRAEGSPQFSAQFHDWNLDAAALDSAFAFTPPEGMGQIPFAPRPTGFLPPETEARP
jgi:hypothetical protein